MQHLDFTKMVCQKLDFPKAATTTFVGLEQRLTRQEGAAHELEQLVQAFCHDDSISLHTIIPQVEDLARRVGENPYTVDLLYIIHCLPRTMERYKENSLEETLFWNSAMDLKYKLLECMDCYHIPGTFVAAWNEGFLRLGRFTYGRFQYEPFGLYRGEERTMECGYVMKKGMRYLILHIPSSGESLTDSVRAQSYRLAYEKQKNWVGSDVVLVRTHSWLLFPDHKEFLPPHSHIRSFMEDFEITHREDWDTFEDAWRVFGAYAALPVEEWPEETSLQRAYKNWILDGHTTGCAEGFLVLHNGVNVTHQKGYFKG